MKHLAPEFSYRSLVTLGIASIQGTPVAAFEKEDADRLLFFCTRQGSDLPIQDHAKFCLPRWSSSITKERSKPGLESNPVTPGNNVAENGVAGANADKNGKREKMSIERSPLTILPMRQRSKVAAMRPIPHSRKRKMLPFSGIPETDVYEGHQVKPNLSIVPSVKHSSMPAAPTTHRKSLSSSFHAQQIISLNPLPMKKHGCNRLPIQICPEVSYSIV